MSDEVLIACQVNAPSSIYPSEKYCNKIVRIT